METKQTTEIAVKATTEKSKIHYYMC